jgi:HPt (histidine-containing phosphotransfer) domain-containing protein
MIIGRSRAKNTADLICEDGLQAIAELTGGLSIDLFKRLVSLYEDNAPEVAERIAEAANTQDLDQLAKAAHALKSMSNNIAARNVAETCQAMESLAKAGDMTAFREASEIAELVARTISTLHDCVEVSDREAILRAFAEKLNPVVNTPKWACSKKCSISAD